MTTNSDYSISTLASVVPGALAGSLHSAAIARLPDEHIGKIAASLSSPDLRKLGQDLVELNEAGAKTSLGQRFSAPVAQIAEASKPQQPRPTANKPFNPKP